MFVLDWLKQLPQAHVLIPYPELTPLFGNMMMGMGID
jgi:hypothetical protein